MGQLGQVGFGAYNINGTLLVVGPEGAKILERKDTLEELLDEVIDGVQEDDVYLDYKINTGGTW